MRRNIEKRLEAIEKHKDVERAELDYNDGEVVIMALAEKIDEEFENFIENLGMSILSGPKYVGIGITVILA